MRISVVTFLFLVLTSCKEQPKKDYSSPPGYDINKPEKIKVKEILDEISGIVYDKKNNALIAVNDEQGKLFSIDLANTFDYKISKFGGSGDYEDLAYTGKEWYVLKSNGDIYLMKNIFTDSSSSDKFTYPEKGNEFEGLYFDETSNCLWLLCKSCAADNNKKAVSVYTFDIATKQFKTEPAWQLNVKQIEEQLSDKSLQFKPSAIAMHPLQKQLYILSGVNKMLIVADSSGNVLSGYKLNPYNFRQPEGITFSDNGDMYISNEGNDDAYANILKFTYQPATK